MGEPEGLAALMFKAKGLKHRTAGTRTAVQARAREWFLAQRA